jgi:DNA-binding response OmpR family regulator
MVARERILVVEDEADIRELMLYNLQREGYLVQGTARGEEGLERARAERPDLLLLDRMLPGLSGIEVCRRLKSEDATRSIGVIMVTARTSAEDMCGGLEVGADDYIPKPFSPKVLLARVRAVLRRLRPRAPEPVLARVTLEGLVVDPERHEVEADGAKVTLTATEFRLLHQLASNPGRVFTRAHLLARVIGESTTVIDRNIDVHVASVRRKLGGQREWIETLRGVGYRFRDVRP